MARRRSSHRAGETPPVVLRYGLWLHVTAAWAVLTYALASAQWLLCAAGLAAIAASWKIFEGNDKQGALPRLFINASLLVAGVSVLPVVTADGIGVTDFATVVVVLLSLKFFDRRAPRDDVQILVLSVFLAVGAVLTSTALWVGLLTVVGPALVLWTASLFHLAASTWRMRETEARLLDAEQRPAVPSRVRVSGGVQKQLRLLVGVSGAASFVVGIVVFVSAPRGLARDSLGSWSTVSVGRETGFNDEIELGQGGLLSESEVVVLDLVVTDADGNRRGGEFETYYLVGAVLDTYRDGRWTAGQEQAPRRAGATLDQEWRSYGASARGGTELHQRITIRNAPEGAGPLFAVHRGVRLRSPDNIGIMASRGGEVLRRTGGGGKMAYDVVSLRDEPGIAGAPRTIAVFDSEVVEGIAREVLEAEDLSFDPFERTDEQNEFAVRVFESYLERECRYSVDIEAADSEPVEWFLTESREGHCEYFASALAALCRSAGIDARVITGYVAAEWNPTTSHYTVRESDAHAWVQAEVRPGVWRTYDPTPPAEFDAIHQPPSGLLQTLRGLVEAAEYAWIESVVGFKGTSPIEDGTSSLAMAVASANNWFQQTIGTRDRSSDSGSIASAGFVIATVLLVFGAGLVVLVVVVRRKLLGGTGRARTGPPEYRQMLRRWKRADLAKPASRPPLAHFRLIRDRLGEAAAADRAVIDRLYEARFRTTSENS